MSSICDADLHYLKPGKRVLLKSFNGGLTAPEETLAQENYWRLIGSKAVVSATSPGDSARALITFESDLQSLGLLCDKALGNSLWVAIADLKFVCR